MDIAAFIIIGLIVAAVAALAIMGERKSPGGQRGSTPGKGDHILESDYQSGVGGGQYTRWSVPQDPQAYARRFVPKDKSK